MGDGGVACAPSHHVMERFPASEAFCAGGVLASKAFKMRRAEEGELEKGEFVPERRRGESHKGEVQNGELAKGDLVSDRRRHEIEAGEFVPERVRRGESEKRRKGSELERVEFTSGRSRRGELEKGEFVPERWRKDGQECDQTPDDSHRRKDGDHSESDYRKRPSSKLEKCDTDAHERDSRKYPRVAEEELDQHKYELSNGKSRDRSYHVVNRTKRHCPDLDSSSRKYYAENTDRSGSKSWRETEEWKRTSNRERMNSSSRYSSSSRHVESLFPFRGSRDRHGRSPERARHHDPRDRSPGHLERSPRDRTRYHDHRDHTPGHSDRSPHERARYQDFRDGTPGRSDRSPQDRGRCQDYRDRTPSHSNRSPHERGQYQGHRDRTPVRSERSPHDRGRNIDSRELYTKTGGSERHQNNRYEEKSGRESAGKDASKNNSTRQSNSSSSSCHGRGVDDKSKKKKGMESSNKEPKGPPLPPPPPPPPLPPVLPPPPPLPPQSEANGFLEELPSMEEDMDISNTPPHDTIMADMGKWFYIDQFGLEQGPSRLSDLNRLVKEGYLHSDHLIKHSDTDRWVTVENAASPLLPTDLPSVVSDAVTQMVNPPEAPGNLLADVSDPIPEMLIRMSQQEFHREDCPIPSDFIGDFCIDQRVEALLNGHTVTDGKELETIGEALNVTFEHAEWEKWGHSEGFTRFQACMYEPSGLARDEGAVRNFEGLPREVTEARPSAPPEKETSIHNRDFSDWFVGRWSCKGGDWKRNDESGQDRHYKKKFVLNEGYPLCQMPKSELEDPRLYRRDDLYYPSCPRKLDLPPWASSSVDDKNDSGNDVNKNKSKMPIPRGVKGTMLPVVRINACVVKDHGPSEPRTKVRCKEWQTPRSSRSYSTSNETSSFIEGSHHSKKLHERDLQSSHKCRTVIDIPRDHVCTLDELSLDLGDWYFLDGAGHEHGPSSYSELQELVSRGIIPEHSTVFRKVDNVWLPITAGIASETVHTQEATPMTQMQILQNDACNASHSFHSVHPQFVGYMRGKLHELVMKSYKNREFAASINEVLDPWLSTRQPKKDMDKHFPFNSSITKSSAVLAHEGTFGSYEDNSRSAKRARLLVDESGESEAEEDLPLGIKNDSSFEDICGEATFVPGEVTSSEAEIESWGFLNGRILARIFHFLRADMKSLVSSSSTCNHWNRAVQFYKNLCKHVDFSLVGLNCTDSIFVSVLGGYEKKNVTSIGLAGCSNVNARVLEDVLPLFPCLSHIDIRGCSQFKDLDSKYQDIHWVKSSPKTKSLEESHSKIRTLKQISKSSRNHELDKKDSLSHTFRQGFYKRTKPLDARKSSVAPSRDAHMRQWLHKNSRNGYRKMEEFVALSLKDIMKGNRFEFFIPKVAKIEDRMRSGYYIRYGLGSVKDDISRMCRDALKLKNRDNAGDLKQVILSFIQLAESLKENPKLYRARDEMTKTLKDSSDAGLYSSATKYPKKQNKFTSEKKGINRNGGTDNGAYAFDREIKRSLSKLKKKYTRSESETSDDHDDDLSEEGVRCEAESSASDTESDLDLHSGGGAGDAKGDGYFTADDTLDSTTEDREWGARMTKASLVPPVTRKYEVIDKYLIIADEEEVQRKMRVALPDDFTEKLLALKSGIEESDMELPEVKEYKPRKLVGAEVLEQEVYGIDPYTHNLLLDSMPDETDWPLGEKHKFIEEVLLCILNKQVRQFTGTGNTPMVYPLRPVVEEIQKNAELDCDTHRLRMCQAILKAMHTRPDDNYVAYRKGLGVVCNKEEGFGEDDFVVEFLGEVYPTWKWFEKQDGIRSLQKNSDEPLPEFYNIYLERPKGDRDGYDLVVVDAMHKANYASRICHSCRPNCEAKVTAVDGQYQIGIYTVRSIGFGEEITFDYNSVTESKKEYEASVCLCGSQICRGSYLNLTGEGAFQKVLRDCHGILNRHKLMLEACQSNSVSQEDYIDLGRAGLGTCLLAGLPDWLIAYSAHLVRFINLERIRLPGEILRHNLEEKRKFFSDVSVEVEKIEAEVQAEGVYNARLQNMALTLDKVRYVMRRVFGDPKTAPPPLQKLSPEDLVSVIWEGEGSLVEELLQSMTPHVDADLLNNLKFKIHAHNPSRSDDLRRELKKSLLWLRDELRSLPCAYKCRHDAAADLIHMYAYTKCFFRVREYRAVKSSPVYISPLDLGPKFADKLGSGFEEYCKSYGENYCLGQLIYWHSQTNADPDSSLAKARKGCLALPDMSSFYAKSSKPLGQHVYGSRTLRFMLSRMENQPQRAWPKDRIWLFKSSPRFFGSPMLDALLSDSPLDKEMMQWLRSRPSVFQGAWDG